MTYYIFGGSIFDDPACKAYMYVDLGGYNKDLYYEDPRTKSDAHMVEGDPFWRLGGVSGGQESAEIGVHGKFIIEIDDLGIWGLEEGEDPINLLSPGPGGLWFKTITGITNDVVADIPDDTLTLTSANNKFTIVGTSATDTITFTLVEGNINHNALLNYLASRHKTEAEMSLANIGTRPHTALTDVLAGQHHTKWTTGDTEGVITAELAAGQSIDNAIDALLTANADGYYVEADDKYLKNDANDETTGDLTVANLITAGLVDGVDVSGLPAAIAAKDSKEEAHAYVEANALTLEDHLTMANKNIVMGTGLVDGKNVSGLCTTVEALAYANTHGFLIATTKLLAFADGGSVDIIRDEDNMASDDPNALSTQQSIKAYIDAITPGGAGTDTTAIHDNIDGEIDGVAVKAAPTALDLLLIEDVADGDAKKKIQIGTIPVAGDVTGNIANIQVSNDSHDHTEAHISDLDKYTQAQVDGLITPHVDPDAIHDDVAGEIGAIAQAVPTTVDKFLFEDTTDGGNKKQNALGEIDIAGDVTGKLSATVVDKYTQAAVDGLIADFATEAEAHAYVESHALTLTEDLTMSGNNIVMAGAETVDGVDVSGLPASIAAKCTVAEAIQAVEDTGLTMSKGKIISIDAVQLDTGYSGKCLAIDTTGCNLFDLVYIDGADSVAPADASDDTKMPAIGIVVMAGKVLTSGVVTDDDLIVCTTAKAVVYASTTLRKVTETAPNGVGNMIQVVGICIGDHSLYVNVSLDMVEFVA